MTGFSTGDDLRVLVIADDPLARTGLATLLTAQPARIVVGQTAGDADLLAELDVYRPDVVVWDLSWEPPLALDRLADLKDTGLPIVALLTDDTFATEAWTSGARGLLLRDTDSDSDSNFAKPIRRPGSDRQDRQRGRGPAG
jgi:DNA-binding NarL/FixJ family response regulator